MSGHLVTKYVQLTETIAVPEEWPVHALQKFLIPLIKKVIDAVNGEKSVVLQVLNQPAMLVQRQNRNGMQYFFDKVFTEELMGSYVIDVIFDTNDRNTRAMDVRPFSFDDYRVKVYRSEYRTAYYLIPVVQSTNCDVIFLLAAVGIPPLVFVLILLFETYGK